MGIEGGGRGRPMERERERASFDGQGGVGLGRFLIGTEIWGWRQVGEEVENVQVVSVFPWPFIFGSQSFVDYSWVIHSRAITS